MVNIEFGLEKESLKILADNLISFSASHRLIHQIKML